MKRATTLMRSMLDSSSTSEPYLNAHELRTLAAACARLIPQPEREPFLGIARTIDFRLAAERAGQWPGSAHFLGAEAFRLGLRGLNELSRARLRCDFAGLDALRQDQILASVQRGIVAGESWLQISPQRFFEELLREATEIYHTAPVTEEAV